MDIDLSTLTETSISYLWHIYKYKKEHWNTPTYRQLADMTGVKAVSHISRHVTRLKNQGLVSETPGGNLDFDKDRVEEFLRAAGYDISP